MEILIADDDSTSRAILTNLLQVEGHDVITAVDGMEAWRILKAPGASHLAILDGILETVDKALYRPKNEGRNRVVAG